VHWCALRNKSNGAVNSVVTATIFLETAVCCTAVKYNCSSRFDPLSDVVHRGLRTAVPYYNKEHVARLTFHTTEDPLLSHHTVAVALTLTKLALNNFDGLTFIIKPEENLQRMKHAIK
jgi:hypothetical protein